MVLKTDWILKESNQMYCKKAKESSNLWYKTISRKGLLTRDVKAILIFRTLIHDSQNPLNPFVTANLAPVKSKSAGETIYELND